MTQSAVGAHARKPGNAAIAATVAGLILAAASASAMAAQAAAPAGDEALEEITITGTSIRGAAPVGNNLITVNREAIGETGAQTVQQILQNVPAVTGFGNAAQGGFGSADGSGTFAPTIHGLGASASNGTLVLIDGHRLPLTGLNHTLADPNIIAALAIERVEVLPDGASSTYGSDAVAGVINFITRRNFKGFEASAQAGFGSKYDTQSAGFLWGDTWDQSSVLLSYDYSRRSALKASDRSFTAADHRAQGGANFGSFACGQATVNNILAPYTGTAPTSAPCDYTGVADLLPENIRHSLLLKATHDFNDRVSFTSDTVFSKEANTAAVSRGSITNIRTFGTGGPTGQVNPFFQAPASVNPVTGATVSWDANDMFGPGAKNAAGNQVVMNSSGLQVKMGGDWVGAFGFTLGTAESNLLTTGTICTSCAILALNGTTSSGGSTGAVTQPGTGGIAGTVLLPLAANGSNALDVWNAGAANLTSAAVRSQLLDSATAQNTHQTLQDFSLKFDGSLFAMPGGEAKAAVGAEFLRYQLSQQVIRARNTGPNSQNSGTTFLGYGRNVTSAYGELLLPIFGEGNATAFAKRFDISLSGRFDKYSDFGNTTNPKLAFTWSVNSGVSLRGNYAKSFTAPALTSRGNADGITAESSYTPNALSNFNIPNTYPNAIGLPGCTALTPVCTLGPSNGTVPGIQVNGGNKNLKPEKGTSWSVGLDLTPTAVDGLGIHLTYWNAKYEGMITAASASFAIGSPGLQNNLQLFPGNGGNGATTAEIAAATAGLAAGGVLPSKVFYIFSFQQANALNLNATGLDFDIGYKFKTGANNTWSADLTGSRKLKMDQQFGVGGEWFSVLNTAGINTTFPSVATSMRLNLGWKGEGFKVNLFTNYSGAYTNRNGNAPFPLVRSATFAPIGGGQPVDSLMTFDAHASYSLPDSGFLAKAELNLDISNLTDKKPPFFNVAQGYDGFGGNPIGRVVTIGLSKKW